MKHTCSLLPTVYNQSVHCGVCLEVFSFPRSALSHSVGVRECWDDCCWKTLWMPAGRRLKESLCSFVMRCWDKGSIHHVSPCQRAPQGRRPLLTWNCDHIACVLADGSDVDWWLCIVRLLFGWLFLSAVKAVLVLWGFDVCFPRSSDPVICFHSPAWEPLLCMCVLSSLCACLHTVSSVCGHVVLKCFSQIRLVRWQKGGGWREWGHCG